MKQLFTDKARRYADCLAGLQRQDRKRLARWVLAPYQDRPKVAFWIKEALTYACRTHAFVPEIWSGKLVKRFYENTVLAAMKDAR